MNKFTKITLKSMLLLPITMGTVTPVVGVSADALTKNTTHTEEAHTASTSEDSKGSVEQSKQIDQKRVDTVGQLNKVDQTNTDTVGQQEQSSTDQVKETTQSQSNGSASKPTVDREANTPQHSDKQSTKASSADVTDTTPMTEVVPDEALQVCIASAIDKPVDSITVIDMKQNRSSIYVPATLGHNSSDNRLPINFEGVQYLTHTTDLTISCANGNVQPGYMDLSNIADMPNLETLAISGLGEAPTKYPDFSQIKTLGFLSISETCQQYDDATNNFNNNILTSIHDLPNLTYLELSQGNITSVKAVPSMLQTLPKLETLDLERNRIYDFSPLANIDFNNLSNRDFTLKAEYQNGYNSYSLNMSDLQYASNTRELTIPFDKMQGLMKNYDGSIAYPTDISDFNLQINDRYVDSNRLSVNSKGYVIHDVTEADLKNIKSVFVDAQGSTGDEGKVPVGIQSDNWQTGSNAIAHRINIIAEKSVDVTVKYEDETGKEIAKRESLSGNIGETYKTEQKQIEGYTFKEVKGNPTGKFTDQDQTVTYVYTKKPVKAVDVTVKYEDETGKEIAKRESLSGNIGETYKAEQKQIEGYTFKEVKGNPTGKFTDQNQIVTYVYKVNKNTNQPKVENKDHNSAHSNDPIKHDTKKTPINQHGTSGVEKVVKTGQKQLQRLLPNTASRVEASLSIVGAVLLAIGTALYYKKRK
ncbi:MucBP domain-containing protein [Weissella viridescens]|uniref:MucBP domain-containing protein n=1 Tax=Weissella viridescens TaxID=1629 RepID=UPI003AF2BACA